MRTCKWVVLSSCGVLVGVVAVGLMSRADAAGGEFIKPAVTRADPVAHLTRLQLDVFELTCTYARLADFSLDRIGGGQPPASEVLERLSQLGHARLVLRYDNVVDLPEQTTVSTGQRVPAVRDVVISADGNITPSVGYEQVGFVANISGVWLDEDDPMQAKVSFGIECSDLQDESLEIAEEVSVPVFTQRLLTEETRVLRSREPVWLACNDPDLSGDADDETKMTVIRLTATRLTD